MCEYKSVVIASFCFLFLNPFAAYCVVTGGEIELLAKLEISEKGTDVEVGGHWAFSAVQEGVVVVDLWYSRTPRVVDRYDLTGSVVDIEISSLDEIYVLVQDYPNSGDIGLVVLEWSEANGLNQRTSRLIEPYANYRPLEGMSLRVQNDTLSITARAALSDTGKLIQVDVSDPEQTAVYGGYELRDRASDSVKNEYLSYVAAGDGGLSVERLPGYWWPDFSNPDPRYDSSGYANRVEYRDGLCYVADGDGGLLIVDPRTQEYYTQGSDKQFPVLLSQFTTHGFGYAQDLFLHESTAFVADGPGGVQVVDIESATQPQQLAWLEPVPGLFFSVRSVCYVEGPDLVVYLTQDGTLGVARYPRRPPPNPDLHPDGRIDWKDVFLLYAGWGQVDPSMTFKDSE